MRKRIILLNGFMMMVFLMGFAEFLGAAWHSSHSPERLWNSVKESEKAQLYLLSNESVEISDEAITSAIKKALRVGRGVSDQTLKIDTTMGIVTLSGTIGNLLAKEKAVHIAETIKGVRAVVDRIHVNPSNPFSDRTILDNIYEALGVDPVTKDESIKVNISNGRVVLEGVVPNWQTRYLVEQVVKGVKGVKSIQNDLRMDQSPLRNDEEIQSAIKKRLQSDAWIEDSRIDVQVNNRNVTLSGAVRSAAEKTRANSHAWFLGVQAVNDDGLQVKWWDRNLMRRDPSDVHPSDEELKEAIHDAFIFDPRVWSMNPDVQVENGVVTLTGVAKNLRAKEAAEEDVRNTTGVVRVKNFISIGSLATQNDREIANEVRRALLRDPYVEKFGIRVSVEEGRAILTGLVDTPFQKWHARRIASSISGIKQIINHIRVDVSKTQKKEQELIWAVKDRLWWNPYIDSYQILVTGEDRTITLSGITDTWIERNLAEQIAYESGAKEVENHIRLRQSSDFEAGS